MSATQITSRFGLSVRTLRHRLGLSQEDLAERANLHRTYITGIECGVRNVTLKSIDKLAHALEVSASTLLLQASVTPEQGEPSDGASSFGQFVDILMVEDDRKDVQLTMEAFKKARITNCVQVVHDGQQASDFFFCAGRFARRKMEDRPDLVLLDLGLPKIGGMEVLRRIKADERTRSIPVAILSATRDQQELAECWRLGAETHIIKPVDFQSLSQATPRLTLDWALLQPSKAKYPDTHENLSISKYPQ